MLLVFAAAALLRVTFVLRLRTPIVFADEVAPSLIGRALLGHHPTPTMVYEPFYHAGYALLTLPWTALLTPIGAWHASTVLNAVLLAATVPLVYLLLRDSFDVPAGLALGAAAVTSMYPAFILEAGFTWSESAVITVVLVTYVTCQRLVRRPTTWNAVAFGASAAGAYAVHARLVPLLVLAPLALWLVHRWQGLSTRSAVLGTATAAVLFGATRLVHSWLQSTLYLGRPASDESEVVARLFRDPVNFVHALGSLIGQSWYLSVATLGLAPLGIVLLASELRRHPRRVDLLYMAAVSAILFAVSALFVVDADRVDKRVYGRYAETSLAIFLAFGLVALARRTRLVERVTAMVVVPVVLGGVLLLAVGRKNFRGVVYPTNVLGIGHFLVDRPGVPVGHITVYAALVAVVLVALALLRQRGATVAFVLVAALFLGASVRTQRDVLEPVRLAHDVTDAVPKALPRIERLAGSRIERVDVVYYPRRDKTAFFSYEFRLPAIAFDIVTGTSPPRGPWVLAPISWPDARSVGARLVYPEGLYDAALWVLPGPQLDRLERAGALGDPSVLPDDGLRARVVPSRTSLDLRRGDATSMSVQLTHDGSAPWPVWFEHGSVGGSVHLRAEWRRAGDDEVRWQNDAELPRRMFPGEHATLTLPVMTRGSTGVSPPPGRYELVFVMVQEGRAPVRVSGPTITVELR